MSSDGRDTRAALVAAIETVVDGDPTVLGATIAGSFSRGRGLEGIADIDTIVVCETVGAGDIERLSAAFRDALTPVVEGAGKKLHINTSLGPLKFDDGQTAVLHLMIYSADDHREHVIRSPFTCFDWQRSPLVFGKSLAEIYPVYALQPHHFFSGRRGVDDYLRDLTAGVVSYRTIEYDGDLRHEVRREKPMGSREYVEFSYHIMKFLMQNVLKLINRQNEASEGQQLLDEYCRQFSPSASAFRPLYLSLEEMKKQGRTDVERESLLREVTAFVHAFAAQFNEDFVEQAQRHVLFRHGPTKSQAAGGPVVFCGRQDAALDEDALQQRDLSLLRATLARLDEPRFFSSPSSRCRQSLAHVLSTSSDRDGSVTVDERLVEIDYGQVDGMTVAEAKAVHQWLFDEWAKGQDPHFPDGENTAAVTKRVMAFARDGLGLQRSAVVSTHNVVLRCLLGSSFAVPQHQWYRLKVEHLVPYSFVATKRFGLFADLDQSVERHLFSAFLEGSI